MNQLARQHARRFALDDWLRIERDGNVRHEFIDGELVAMTGTSDEHNEIIQNLILALGPHLRPTRCRLRFIDMKVWIASANRGYYPDLMVSCEPRTGQPDDRTETQPRLVVEVLSPSTEGTDRTRKLQHYQTLPSLQEYVLVAQDKQAVEIYRRAGNRWTQLAFRAGESVTFESIDLTVSLATIYQDVFPERVS